jgi:hypothetical protein
MTMLDPVSAALLAATVAGATSGLTDASKTAVTDAYHALTTVIRKRFGQDHAVVKAVEAVESKPSSAGRQSTLVEEVTEAGLAQDPELLWLAEQLTNLLVEHARDQQAVQQIISGDYNATSVHGDATVTVERPRDK